VVGVRVHVERPHGGHPPPGAAEPAEVAEVSDATAEPTTAPSDEATDALAATEPATDEVVADAAATQPSGTETETAAVESTEPSAEQPADASAEVPFGDAVVEDNSK